MKFPRVSKKEKKKNKNHDLLGRGVLEAEGAELPVPWLDDALNWALRDGMHGAIGVSEAKKGAILDHSPLG